MSALLTKAFEKWVAECTASNLPARPDAIIFALMEREPTHEDNTVPEEKITYAVNELTYGQLSPNNIVCSAVVPDDCAFSYDWICLIHQASGTLCGVIKTPVQQKVTGESLIRNFTIIYSGIAQAAQITVPPQSWQVDLFPEINKKAPLDSPAFTGTPTTPTPPDDATGLEMANAAFVRKLLAALVDSSPEALDTLNELAAALGNDPNFATTVTKALAGKQPLNDVLTAVSQIIPEENTLPYFSAEGRILLAQLSEKARALLALDTPEAMRTELELKAAGTMDPQSDIRDRTPGRLALPGAFGFGYAFSQSERLDFNSDEKFLEWVKNATEGRYFIYSYNSKIFPDRNSFTGIVDVNLFPSGSSNGNPAKTDKGLFFYSRYQPDSEQSVFYVQYSSVYADGVVTWGLTSVRNLSLTSKMLSEYLSSTAGAGTYFQYPGIGVPVLAVYRGTAAGDNEIRIGLGDVVHGSCLGSVNITCLIGATGVYSSTPRVGASAYSFPGRYMAISGDRGSYGDEGHICLFVRIE